MWQEFFKWQEILRWQELWGFVGVFLILFAYFSVQLGLDSYGTKADQQLRFSFLNLVGAFLVLVSLYGSDNYAAMFLESAWVVISLIGIYKATQIKNNVLV